MRHHPVIQHIIISATKCMSDANTTQIFSGKKNLFLKRALNEQQIINGMA